MTRHEMEAFKQGIRDLVVGVSRALRGTARLVDNDTRQHRALALRYVARVLADEATRLEAPHDERDDERRDAIRADFVATVRQPRVIQ